MGTFIFYTIATILLGLFVKTFWPALLVIWYAFLFILNLIIGSWVIAIVVMMFSFLVNGNKLEGFNTIWTYCAMFYTVASVVYLLIIVDVISIVGTTILRLFRK